MKNLKLVSKNSSCYSGFDVPVQEEQNDYEEPVTFYIEK
jgi:hypothetical protein